MRGPPQPWLLALVVALAAGCSSPNPADPVDAGSSSSGSSSSSSGSGSGGSSGASSGSTSSSSGSGASSGSSPSTSSSSGSTSGASSGSSSGSTSGATSGSSSGTSSSGASSSSSSGASSGGAVRPLPPVPLRTQGRWILDASGKRFKLAAVSWYGAESADFVVGGLDRRPLDELAGRIRELGFNAVRLPWSNQLVETNPVVDAARLAANPALKGLSALDVLDRVIAAVARQGLLVILDNHLSTAGWCCSETDGNGLWYTADFPESAWLADWAAMARRYRSQPAVVGAELRNELRPAGGVSPTWGDGNARTDWKGAAERGAAAVLQENPGLLVVVQGLASSASFQGAYDRPVTLPVADRLVYAPHDYAWYHRGAERFDPLHTALGDQWGFLLVQGQPYTAPVWVSEFGTCNTGTSCVSDAYGDGRWFLSFTRYLAEADIDWAYWPLNGTQSSGDGRTLGAAETFGVLGTDWTATSNDDLLTALRALQPATQGP